MGCSLGILSKLYVNQVISAGGTFAAPVWALADLVSDLNVNSGWNQGESSVRRGRLQTFEPTNMALELTGSIRKDINDDAFFEIWRAHLNGTLVDVLVLDGLKEVDDSEGYRFTGRVFDWGEDQGLQTVLFKTFTIRPSCFDADEPAQHAIVTGGTLTFTALGGSQQNHQ